MRPAVRIRNRVRERQNLVVIAVVVLHDNIDKNFVALTRDHHWLGMNDLFVFTELLDEFLDAVLVKKGLFLRRVATFIRERDLQTGIQERQLAQSRRQALELKLCRDRENRRVRQKSNEGAGCLFVFDFADDRELVGCFAFGEGHVIDFALARDFHFEPVGKCVRAFRAHAVQAAGIFVSALSEFSPGVQICQHQLDRRHFPFRMNIHWDPAAVVAHRNRPIDMNGHFDSVATSSQMFVDGIVENFENHVMQTALVGVADVHPGSLAHCFQALQFVDLRGVVFLHRADSGHPIARQFFDRNFVLSLEHK